jgi:hypothetical protein
MRRPIKCPSGTTYDASVYLECPCPNCWADRSFVRLAKRTHLPPKPGLNGDRPALPDALSVATIGREHSADHQRPTRSTADDVWRSLTGAQVAAFLLATLAIPSALLSWYSPVDPWDVFSVFSQPRKQELLPGIYFGLVLCTGIYLWGPRNARYVALVFIAVLLSWICAYQIAVEISMILDAALTPPSLAEILSSRNFLKTFAFGISGLAGGLAGSIGTAIGVSLVSPNLRNPWFFLRTVLIGFLAGGLLQVVTVSVLPLFIVWQPAIAGCVAYSLVSSETSQKRKPSGCLLTRRAMIVILAATLTIGAVAAFFRHQVDATAAAQESSEHAPSAIEAVGRWKPLK